MGLPIISLHFLFVHGKNFRHAHVFKHMISQLKHWGYFSLGIALFLTPFILMLRPPWYLNALMMVGLVMVINSVKVGEK